MPFQYVEVDEAIAMGGLRMVVVGNVPSPWGEAAKGLFHIKGVDWSAVRLAYDNPALEKWAGELTGPVAIYEDEAPRSGWADILFLAECLNPEPPLLPDDAKDRAFMFGLSHEILGLKGLCWSRRLHSVHEGLHGRPGFPEPVAQYLAGKYGHTEEMGEAAGARVVELLAMLADQLKAQRAAGSAYYIGGRLSAVDVYSAAAMALFAPLPEPLCAMNPKTRAAFESMDEATRAALDPILLEHRDRIYADHLETPLSL